MIGNPPYIKEKENKKAFDNLHSSPYYKGKMDIWFLFTCRALDLLSENGILSFIAQNQWYTSDGASKMREKIRTDSKVIRITDFNSYMVFNSASTQTMVFLIRKNSNDEKYKFSFRKILEKESTKQDMLDCIDYLEHENILSENYEYNRNTMKDKFFIFTNSKNEKIINKIIEKSNFNFTDKEISQGIIGGPDEAFKFENIDNFTENEKKYLFKFYTSTKAYVLEETNTYIFYSSKITLKKFSAAQFPNIFIQVNKYKDKLLERRETQNGRNEWFHLWWCRDKNTFEKGAKIIWTSRSLGKCFTYTEDEFYGSRNLFFIKSDRINLKYICGVLNSNLCTFLMNQLLKHNGELLQIDKVQFQNVPLYVPNKTSQEKIVYLVDEILAAKKSNTNANTSELEHKIDKMVYKLYGLTAEEIAIVEGKNN